jgi:hypothetical protein
MHKQVISTPSPNPHFNARLHCFGHIFRLPSITTMCPLWASRGRRPTFAMAMEHVGTTMPWPRRSMEASLPSLGWGSIYNRGLSCERHFLEVWHRRQGRVQHHRESEWADLTVFECSDGGNILRGSILMATPKGWEWLHGDARCNSIWTLRKMKRQNLSYPWLKQ